MLASNLIKLLPKVKFNVVSDDNFNTFALCGWDGSKQLVPLFDKNFINKVFEDKNVSCILTSPDVLKKIPLNLQKKKSLIVTENCHEVLYELHFKILEIENQKMKKSQVHSSASVHPSSHVDEIGVKIGANTIIGPNCTILKGTEITKNCKINSNVVLGEDGYEVRIINGKKKIIPHIGGILIKDNVDIQSGTIVLKPIFQTKTVVGQSVKIGSGAIISHGVRIKQNAQICASSVICGNVEIGNNVYIGPNSTISNNLKIGNRAKVTLGSTVVSNIPHSQTYTGYFSIEHEKFLRKFIK